MYSTENVIKAITKAHKRMFAWGAILPVGLYVLAERVTGYNTAYEGILLVGALFSSIGYFSWRRQEKRGLKEDLEAYYQLIRVSAIEVDELELNLKQRKFELKDGSLFQIGNFIVNTTGDTIRQNVVYLPLVKAIFVSTYKNRYGRFKAIKFTYGDDVKLQSVTFAFKIKTGREKDRWNKFVEMIGVKNPKAVWY